MKIENIDEAIKVLKEYQNLKELLDIAENTKIEKLQIRITVDDYKGCVKNLDISDDYKQEIWDTLIDIGNRYKDYINNL